MANFVQDYINRHIKPLTDTDSYKVIHDVAKPFYNTQKLIASFKDFFDEAGAINARMQMDCPSLHSSKSKH